MEDSPYPPDIDRPRAGAERVEWFLASIYCACGVGKDTCTGHFYTLASCNPNGCGMPNRVRKDVAGMIERGLSDRQIWDELVKAHGPLMLRPHLAAVSPVCGSSSRRQPAGVGATGGLTPRRSPLC